MLRDRDYARSVPLSPSCIDILECPLCAGGLAGEGGSLICPQGHTFDIARSGYVNLAPNSSIPGDSQEMVAARHRFLSAGHFAPLLEAVMASAAQPPGVVLEVGSGTGYYLDGVRGERPGLGLDVSKHATRRASSAYPGCSFAVADIRERIPVATGSVAVLLDVFAPRNPSEFARAVRPGGTLVVAVPGAGHLGGLIAELGMLEVPSGKTDAVIGAVAPHFELAERTALRFEMVLGPEDLSDLVGMGPSAHHPKRGATVPDGPTRVEAEIEVLSFARSP